MNTHDDLDVVWERLVHEYSKITNQHLPPDASLLSIQHSIDTTLARSNSSHNAKARKIIANAGQCVQRFGDIVASAASVAFGPSAQCMNAISFVISAAQACQEMLDGFLTLMERSMAFLNRLNMFLEERKTATYLPDHLRGPAYEFLGHFLRVLAGSYKVANSKVEKFKKYAKVVLFNDDSGVKADLELMERIVRDLLNVEVDEILRDVKGLARYLQESDEERQRHHDQIMEQLEQALQTTSGVDDRTQQIKQAQDRQISQQMHEKALKQIREAIPVDATDSWQEHHKRLQGIRLPGTGEWLRGLAPFLTWADLCQDAPSTMVLQGDEGYGKSILCSYVVDFLVNRSRTSSRNEVHVAWYYFHQDTDLYSSVEECLGSLIYQLASTNPTYASAVAEACRLAAHLGRAEQLWTSLVAELQPLISSCFLIIDGYSATGQEPDAAKMMNTLIKENNTSNKMRIFLSTSDADFVDTTGNFISLGSDSNAARSNLHLPGVYGQNLPQRYGAIDGTPINHADLLLVSRTKLDTLCQVDPDLRSILQASDDDAASKLVKGIAGDYRLLFTKINEINTSDTTKRVMDVLNSAGEDRVQSLTRIIHGLNTSLRSDEVQELNEMLMWAMDACGVKKVSILQAAVLMKTGESYQLRKQVANTFSSILRVGEDDDIELVFGAADLRAAMLMPDRPDGGPGTEDDSSQAVQKCEIDIVQHFLQVNCRVDLYRRLGFEKFFKDAMTRHSMAVCVNTEQDNHVRLAELCLDSLSLQYDEVVYPTRPEPIRIYAARWFQEHLCKIDPQLTERSALRRIGGKLAKLLWDAASIDHWWSVDLLWYLTMDWLSTEENVNQLWTFLSYPSVAAGYQTAHEKDVWLRATMAQKGANMRLLSRVASRLASKWILGLSQHFSCFARAERIMSHIWSGNCREIRNYAMPDPEQLDRIMPWLRSQQHLATVGDADWNLKVAEVFARYGGKGFATKALAHLALVEQDRPGDLGALREQARAHFKLQAYSKCLECIEKLPATRRSMILEPEVLNTSLSVLKLDLMRARCYRGLENLNSAIGWLRSVLERAVQLIFDDRVISVMNDTTAELYQCLIEEDLCDILVAHVLSWRSIEGGVEKFAVLDQERLEVHVITAAYRTARWREVCDFFHEAVRDLSTSPKGVDRSQVCTLQATEVTLLYYCSGNASDENQAMNMWEKMIHLSPHAPDRARERLAHALYDRAVRHDGNTPNIHTERLFRLWEHVTNDSRLVRASSKVTIDYLVARLQHASGNLEDAKATLQDRMSGILDNWIQNQPNPEDSSQTIDDRFLQIAGTLLPLDDNVNVIAALHRRHYTQHFPADRTVLFPCRGCGSASSSSKDISDVYVCKQCNFWESSIFCPPCYSKLQSGELKIAPTKCSSRHLHLYIPAIDVERRDGLEPEEMVVGGRVVQTGAWLDGLRSEWGLNVQSEALLARRAEREKRVAASDRRARWWRHKYLTK